MPDFETVRIRAPYDAQAVYRGETRHFSVDETFEVPMVALSRADAKPVAMIHRHNVRGPTEWINFVDVEGKLFRPFLVDDMDILWTPHRCCNHAPIVRLDDTWLGHPPH